MSRACNEPQALRVLEDLDAEDRAVMVQPPRGIPAPDAHITIIGRRDEAEALSAPLALLTVARDGPRPGFVSSEHEARNELA
jgi:hypothetical protein